MDAKFSFLNGYLKEEVYVEQPQGFIDKGKEDNIYRLKRDLYGLKQAPRDWYSRIDNYLHDHGFDKCPSDFLNCLKTWQINDNLHMSAIKDNTNIHK
jgi:hypothetical protein